MKLQSPQTEHGFSALASLHSSLEPFDSAHNALATGGCHVKAIIRRCKHAGDAHRDASLTGVPAISAESLLPDRSRGQPCRTPGIVWNAALPAIDHALRAPRCAAEGAYGTVERGKQINPDGSIAYVAIKRLKRQDLTEEVRHLCPDFETIRGTRSDCEKELPTTICARP